jgi:hypothetical protein
MRKKSKYKPKGIRTNALGYVLESLKPVTQHESYLLDLKIKNSIAMAALLKGQANMSDIDTLVAMSNIVEALHQLGFGAEYKDVAVAGREAILRIVYRAKEITRFTPTGLEIQALNELMELHDAQMEVITIRDMERANEFVLKQIRNKNTIKLPKVLEEV